MAADAMANFGDDDSGGEEEEEGDGDGDGKLETLQVFFVELGLISMGIVDTMMAGEGGDGACLHSHPHMNLHTHTTCIITRLHSSTFHLTPHHATF